VLVIKGTGRAADRIAAALDGDRTDARASSLAGSSLVTAVSWAEGPPAVRAALEKLANRSSAEEPRAEPSALNALAPAVRGLTSITDLSCRPATGPWQHTPGCGNVNDLIPT
jgi:hypothetical protein